MSAGEVVQTSSLVTIVVGVGLAGGSLLNRWRYGNGFGPRLTRVNASVGRYAFVVAALAAVVFGISVAISGGIRVR
jgi:ABC-type transporter Mla maintaining outer membrane lipid asymmetry permease subunit MlaE